MKSPVLKVLKSQNSSSEKTAFKVFDLGTFSAKIRYQLPQKRTLRLFLRNFFYSTYRMHDKQPIFTLNSFF